MNQCPKCHNWLYYDYKTKMYYCDVCEYEEEDTYKYRTRMRKGDE